MPPSPPPASVPAGSVTRIALPRVSPGTERALTVLRFGRPGARPKAYFQAALHADEIPGLLVLNHLAARLAAAEAVGAVRGEVVVVPVANPVGLAQQVHGKLLGRFELDDGGNFNRHYPDLADEVEERVRHRLGADAAANVRLVREAMLSSLERMKRPGETGFLRLTLMCLAIDADIALDLHCDFEALMHLYLGTPLWPGAADLSAQIGSRATLLATVSGGNPFDEAVGGPWWTLARRFPDRPIPPACLSGTIELRGERDVHEELARADADNLFRFLQRRGVVAGDPGPLPARLCDATPLEGVDMVSAPAAGIVSYTREPGDRVRAGDTVAVLIDPLEHDFAAARSEVRTVATGVLFERRLNRIARPGQILCKVAGAQPLQERIGMPLLTG